MGLKKVYVKVPASIGNMGSGFDCAGLSLKLYNKFIVERAKNSKIEFLNPPEEVSSEQVMLLFLKAFNVAVETIGEKPFSVRVGIENNIPFKRGFGSSATVILGGVISALLLTGRKVKKEDVLKISLPIEGHIDNLAASLYSGFTIGNVDTLQIVSIRPPEELIVVAFIPEKGLSTKSARDVLPSKVSLSDAVNNISSAGFLCSAFMLNRLELLRVGLNDKLHQPYRMKVIPHLKTLLFDKRPASVIGGCLSGAGPSVIFFTEKKNGKKVLLEVKDIVKKEKLKGDVSLFYPGGRTEWKVVK